MRSPRERFRVPGEDLAWPVPLAVLVAALTSAGAAAGAWAPHASAATPPAAPPPPPPAPIVVVAPAPAPSVVAPSSCPRWIVTFAHASARPPSEASEPLGRLGAWLVAHEAATVILDGHADSTGTDQGNLAFSRNRANAIADALLAHGVPRARITARGFGSFSPAEGESDSAARNRRVVIHVRGGEGCPSRSEEVFGP